jgi:hypothetical protein
MRDAVRQQAMERLARRQQVLLAGELRERPRPHAVREWTVGARGRRGDGQFWLLAHTRRF